ncbi:MAG: BrnT family toxin [Acidobacteria bacterium]|nr:BrnT family toxin [Acidobacteriota bacterium]
MRFTWDPDKSKANEKHHDLSFEEARALFSPGNDYLELFDETHSEDEDRFIAIGPVTRGLVLVVYTEREPDEFRIISARWATKREVQQYRAHMKGESR